MNIRRNCRLAGAFIVLASSIAAARPQSAQEGKSTALPPQSKQSDDTSYSKLDYSKEPFVVERLYERYRFENDGTGRKETTLRVHILSDVGLKSFGQLRFGYNSSNDRLEITSVKVTKPDGSVIPAGPDAVQDLSTPVQLAPVYADYREKHVTVPGLRSGDVLECQVTTTFQTPLTPGHFWTEHNFNQSSVVLDERLEIDIPAGRTVKLKTKPGLDPKITNENGRRIYRWTSSHLTGTTESTGKDEKTKKKNVDEVPDVQMTTFTSWEEVGRWYASLEKGRRSPSAEIRAKAQELTKGLTSDLEKTQALYDFVAQNFRYVSLSLGLARYQPQAASDVLRNQYGDCKDKNTLLAALLEAEGLHSSTVLINSFRKLDPDVPSPSQFNHMITTVPLGSEEIWLDTTTEVAPFRLLAYSLRKRQALVIPPEGIPHLEETPADPPMPDMQVEVIDGKVDDTGKLEAKVTDTLRGDAELAMRMLFRAVPSAKWQTLVEGANKSLGGDVTNVKVSDPAATREPFVISYDVVKANFVDWSKKKNSVKLPLAAIRLVPVGADVGDEQDADGSTAENFKLGPPNEHIYKVKMELSSRFHAVVPVPMILDRDYGSYESSYKIDGTMFTAERKLTVRLGELPPARADDYRAFNRSVVADGGQSLTLESSSADIHSAPSGMKTVDLIRSGNEARKNGNYGLAVELLNQAVEADAKSKIAWNDLGLAYFEDWQDALAINAFQKQIEVNPFDQYAYNNLGRVYLRQRKYDEADKSFRKEIEVQPLDKYAHSNLGISLIEQHKYEEAIPELEKAASVTPDKATPEVNLGRAYLNLGQDDKAMAAFDKAVSISAVPTVWNSIAYALALKSAHLDRARSYAESAISVTAASLRNVLLDQVSSRDPGHTASLASYWDTLGWVAFAEGKMDLAERYVSDAWQLGGSSEEADHLGQINEKRGNKAEAEHYYALAMNARRPDPETRARLVTLVGENKVDAALERYRNEQQQSRTLRVANDSGLDGRADFFVLLSPGRGQTAVVEGVSFVDGDDRLKALTEALRNVKFAQQFPDDTPVKIPRRATVTCKAGGECTLVLAVPSDVRSVD